MAIEKDDSAKIAGIYIIIHTLTRKFYIGSTMDFQARVGQHLQALRYKVHSNKKLQRLWSESQPDEFEFSLLERLDSPTQTLLIDAEIKWMKQHSVPKNPLALNPRLAFHKTEYIWQDANCTVLDEYFKGVLVRRYTFTQGK